MRPDINQPTAVLTIAQKKNKLMFFCGYTTMMDEINQWCPNNNTTSNLDTFVPTSCFGNMQAVSSQGDYVLLAPY